MREKRFLSLLSVLVVVGGCSLINKFDDVKQSPATGGTGGAAGSGGTAGSGGGTGGTAGIDGSAGTAGSAGVSGAAGTGGTSGTGGTAGGSGSGGTAGAAGSDAGPTKQGLIVMAADTTASPPQHELDVLDPWTGKRIGQAEQTHALAVAYDAQRDLWYVFKEGTTPVDPATLSMRTFDRGTGKWTELGSGVVPAPYSQSMLAVLKDRVLYLSVFKPTSGPLQYGLSILDTSKPASISVLGASPGQTALPVAFSDARALIGRPNSAAAGGNATLVSEPSQNCSVDAGTSVCPIHVETVTVTPSGTAPSYENGGGKDVGMIPKSGSGIGVAADTSPSSSSDVLALPPLDYPSNPNSAGSVLVLNSSNHNITATIPFAVQGIRINDAAFDPCRKLAMTGELVTDQSIFVVPTKPGGTVLKQSAGTSVQRLVYEPYTKSLIQLFDDSANPQINAYIVGGTDLIPTLEQRSPGSALPWTPPAGVTPKIVVAEQPSIPNCN